MRSRLTDMGNKLGVTSAGGGREGQYRERKKGECYMKSPG